MALKASPNDQAALLELQAIDTRLNQLDHRAKTLPEIVTLAEISPPSAVTAKEVISCKKDSTTPVASIRFCSSLAG